MIEEIDNSIESTKFYKSKHIGVSTFIGGPLAVGYLIYENFKALNKPDLARNAILIGAISTVLLFVIIFSIPENIIDKIPSVVIPTIYTAIIYFLVQKYQGEKLDEHEKNNGSFFSIWRSIGVGVISLTLIVAGILAYFFLIVDNEVYEKYDQEMEIFYNKEERLLNSMII